MNFDWKSLGPTVLSIVGIIVGWGLKEFSDLVRGSNESIRIRQTGLYQLIRLHHEMLRVERILRSKGLLLLAIGRSRPSGLPPHHWYPIQYARPIAFRSPS